MGGGDKLWIYVNRSTSLFMLVLSIYYIIELVKIQRNVLLIAAFCECMSPRQAQFLHRQALSEQLKETEDPALVLHLTSVLLFQTSTHCMLDTPGRCVPQIIGTLTGRIPTVCLMHTQSHITRLLLPQFDLGQTGAMIPKTATNLKQNDSKRKELRCCKNLDLSLIEPWVSKCSSFLTSLVNQTPLIVQQTLHLGEGSGDSSAPRPLFVGFTRSRKKTDLEH